MTPDPFLQLAAWYADADPVMRYPQAACLSTVDGQGDPDARIVLVYQFGEDGFLFSTDRRSAKVEQLTNHPRAALTLYWEALERQVRIRGEVEPGSEQEAERCFAERPRGSRLTAWASRQSAVMTSREELENNYRDQELRFVDCEPVPRPETWCAYRLRASTIEFWQASRHRLHRRELFRLGGDGSWSRQTLEP